jgi:hypothetical protein
LSGVFCGPSGLGGLQCRSNLLFPHWLFSFWSNVLFIIETWVLKSLTLLNCLSLPSVLSVCLFVYLFWYSVFRWIYLKLLYLLMDGSFYHCKIPSLSWITVFVHSLFLSDINIATWGLFGHHFHGRSFSVFLKLFVSFNKCLSPIDSL